MFQCGQRELSFGQIEETVFDFTRHSKRFRKTGDFARTVTLSACTFKITRGRPAIRSRGAMLTTPERRLEAAGSLGLRRLLTPTAPFRLPPPPRRPSFCSGLCHIANSSSVGYERVDSMRMHQGIDGRCLSLPGRDEGTATAADVVCPKTIARNTVRQSDCKSTFAHLTTLRN